MSLASKNNGLLVLMFLGCGLVFMDVLSLRSSQPEAIAATVGNGFVSQSDLEAALEKMRARQFYYSADEVLNFLIDEELLVQRASDVGLIESDRTIRKSLSRAMIDTVRRDVMSVEPSEAKLEEFYAEHQARFQRQEALQLKQYSFKTSTSSDARLRAEQARQAFLSGRPVNAGDDGVSPLPNSLTPVSVLPRLLGPTLAAELSALRQGQISEIYTMDGGYRFYICELFEPAKAKPFTQVRGDVLSEYRRDARDTLLDTTLEHLMREATIEMAMSATKLAAAAEVIQ